MIPRILHQTWKDVAVPGKFRSFSDSWKTLHPGWEYRLWTDTMNRTFMETHFPGPLSLYDAYPHPIQRVDMVRYFILRHMGGLFVDLDFECLRPVEPLLEGCGFVAGQEPPEHAFLHGKDRIISNAFMACESGHPFAIELCDALEVAARNTSRGFKEVLESTGPFMMTHTYKQSMFRDEVRILPFETLYPLAKDPVTGKLTGAARGNAAFQEAYAIHHYWGSWWQPA